MTDIAIRVEDLAKQYRIGTVRSSYRTLRDSIADLFVAPFRRAARILRGEASGAAGLDETIWTLKDVSFEIPRGEAVGIIGPNGSGKSTLLKLLSRITKPTRGSIDVWGRVGSLLEVGAGFHAELTGRENIYLNGAILGMTRADMNRKFDEIVAFSEVEKFLDTPVKHYSSGMYLRLAFAVAAHLEPEILLVDEVLAVGDAAFQKKCLGKMGDIAGEGRTVLFVSHQMTAINRLTSRALHLDSGILVRQGPSHEVVSEYLHERKGAQEWKDPARAPGSDVARLVAVRVLGRDDAVVTSSVDIRDALRIEMEWDVLQGGRVLAPSFELYNDQGVCVFVTFDLSPEWRGTPREPGRYVSVVRIPGNLLTEGTFVVNAVVRSMSMSRSDAHFHERGALAFQVTDSHDGDTARGDYGGKIPGVVRPRLDWTTRFILGN